MCEGRRTKAQECGVEGDDGIARESVLLRGDRSKMQHGREEKRRREWLRGQSLRDKIQLESARAAVHRKGRRGGEAIEKCCE
jgi:hypothetical protein